MLLSIPMPMPGSMVEVVVVLVSIFGSVGSDMSGMVLLSIFGSVKFIVSFMFMFVSGAVLFVFMFDMLLMSGVGDDAAAAETAEVSTGREMEAYS